MHVMYYHKLIVFPIMYDSQFKKWNAQCFLRLHIKYQNGPIFYEAWGHLPNLLFVLSRHCSFNVRIKNPCHRKRPQNMIKNKFLVTCPVSVSPHDVIACFMAIPAATPISAIRL